MSTTIAPDILFCDYYKQWITTYKEGAIRPVTMEKYSMAHQWVEKLVPELRITDLTRIAYQKLLNDYAAEHERQTTMDFHHHLKCAILDAVDEGLIERDPTRFSLFQKHGIIKEMAAFLRLKTAPPYAKSSWIGRRSFNLQVF